MSIKDNKAVTQRQLRVELNKFKKEFRLEIKDEIAGLKQEIFHHFDVVAENIHRDVAEANRDEVSLLHDKVNKHDERITALEQRA